MGQGKTEKIPKKKELFLHKVAAVWRELNIFPFKQNIKVKTDIYIFFNVFRDLE